MGVIAMIRRRSVAWFPSRWRIALLLVVFAGCAVVSVAPGPGNQGDAYLAAHRRDGVSVRHQRLQTDAASLAYVSVGEPGRPVVMFVHGTPGRWSDFVHFLAEPALQDQAWLVSLDRPGWGGSRMAKQPRRVTLQLQSRLIGPLLKALAERSNGCGIVLVGHSLGGSLVARMAIDYRQWVRGLVIIAGSIDPALGKPRWYNTLASVPPVRWLTPAPLAKANTEIMPLHDDLLAMTPGWADLDIPVTDIQGLNDKLVSPKNATFARSVISPTRLHVIEVADQGHFLLWDRPQVVTDAIVDLLARTRRDSCMGPQWAGQSAAVDQVPTTAQ